MSTPTSHKVNTGGSATCTPCTQAHVPGSGVSCVSPGHRMHALPNQGQATMNFVSLCARNVGACI
eukprot:317336-Rhodomonas_salina.4